MRKFLLTLTLLLFLVCPAWAATNDWIAAGAANWSDGTAWSLGHKPAAGEDITMGGTSDQNCVVDENTADLNSFDMTGYSGTLSGSSPLIIVSSTGTQVAKFAGTITHTGSIRLNASTGATLQVTFNSISFVENIDVGISSSQGNTGSIVFMDGLTIGATKTLSLQKGILHTDGASDNSSLTHSWGLFSSSNSNTRALYLGNSTINITGASATVWNSNTPTNLTMDKGTSTINFTGSSAIMVVNAGGGTGSRSFSTVNFTGSGTNNVTCSGGSISFVNFSLQESSGTKTCIFNDQATSGLTVTGIFTANGNSSVNRLLFRSNTLGTAQTLTLSSATISANNVDFRDITFARSDAGALDLTAGGTNSVGDCGGNSKTLGDSSTLTMTSPTTQTVTGSTGNWDVASWTSRVPLPQDTVVISLTAGQTLTANMPRLGKDISVTTACSLAAFTIGVTSYGSVNLTNLAALGSFGSSGTGSWTMESQARTGTIYLTSNGLTFWGTGNRGSILIIQPYNATVELLDALTVQSNAGTSDSFGAVAGILNISNYTVNIRRWSTGNITFGSGTLVLNGQGTSTFGTVVKGTGTISLTGTGAAGAATLALNNQDYNNISISGGRTGAVIFQGTNSFNNITINAPNTVTFPSTTTTTITGDFVATGTSANHITINASTGSSAAILSKASGTVSGDYLDITDSTAQGGASWYAGANSTLTRTSGWVLSAPPSGGPEVVGFGIGFNQGYNEKGFN
jgi:fibronectin-binding autotransporter adhesin